MPKVHYLNTIRTFDNDGFKKRAGCLCFRTEAENEVLLVSSSKTPDKWVVPSGGVEPDEDFATAALREVAEEAGVKGNLGRFLGTFENDKRKHRTAVYVLIVTEECEDWYEGKCGRVRKWFPVDSATAMLRECKPFQASYLDKAVTTR
ncbi:diphosphoinositol polyphosphate phosphohydrolase 1-like [Dendronephthya gigantea]|uniref:diphosphoinositol polyphosphate phosphohydrolase 1-like n=1 Tax=Dendronephthya gigantea TaxID=151771 RepID=UPI00106C1B88|nr:diphosphoinositol polyphosphate phosphohydrolase 1-like [Dendronephthya gigantea]XP_028417574.1 diphosphoinositol polyphosphate phosphohydrolase 1-like [Dendronephthya gigantea]